MRFLRRLLFLTAILLILSGCDKKPAQRFAVSSFRADVTPPVGHMLFTGQFKTATEIETRLEARGLVLQIPDQKSIVLCSVDWSEIRNDTYDLWRDTLAEAAGTTRERVLVSTIHQHDTPLGDLGAERILRSSGSPYQVIDPAFHRTALASVTRALRESLPKAETVTHIGFGQGEVEKIASNRRYELSDGTPKFDRGSACKNIAARHAAEGTIDPFLKSLSFLNGDRELAVYSVYATHPMSFYGTRKVNADFPGLARASRQSETPDALQIYASGCSGNVTAGKYNNGAHENRQILADRLHAGMRAAAEATERQKLSNVVFHNERLALDPRTSAEFTKADLEKRIRENDDARSHLMASLGLSRLERIEREGSEIDVPSVSFNDGAAQIVLLPGEIYIEYQLAAQGLAPDRFIMAVGYGESAPGYIPTEKHWAEKDSNLGDWCWVAEGVEPRILEVLKTLIPK